MRTAATEVVEEKLKRIKGNIAWLKSEIGELNFKSLKAEVRHWIETAVPNNAIMLHLQFDLVCLEFLQKFIVMLHRTIFA
ncbi:MAG: hypothetical protein ACU88J_01690, partial [Gammaproteobacteria bacterium]